MGDRPIRHMRVKNENAVKIKGAMRNSHSSRVAKMDWLAYVVDQRMFKVASFKPS